MAQQEAGKELQMFSYQALEKRWGISLYTIRRLVDKGELRAIGIAGRVLVPRDEVERAERFGVGTGRKKRERKAKA